jgi:uncharacterized iron-regulated membrane protein
MRGQGLHWLMLVLHRYAGLILGLPILILAASGAVLVFEEPLDHFRNPQLFAVEPKASTVSVQSLADRVRTTYPNDTPLEIRFPQDPHHAANAFVRRQGAFVVVFLDQYTGAIKGERGRVSNLMTFIHRLHTGRVAGRGGEIAAGVSTLVALVGVLGGLYLWWPRKIFTVKRGTNWRRTNFDLHSVLGIFASVVLLFTLLTGAMITWDQPIERFLVRWIDGQELEKPSRPESTPREGGRPLTLDEAVAISAQALPGTSFVGINIPPDAKKPYFIGRRFPEDKTGAGRSGVAIDQFSGKVLSARNSRTMPIGTRIMNFSEPIHMGTVLGLGTLILAFLASAALAGQAVTGFLIWWKPRRAGAQSADTEAA